MNRKVLTLLYSCFIMIFMIILLRVGFPTSEKINFSNQRTLRSIERKL